MNDLRWSEMEKDKEAKAQSDCSRCSSSSKSSPHFKLGPLDAALYSIAQHMRITLLYSY